MDNNRNVLLEGLVLEARGFVNVDSRRMIEMCCGWDEGACDMAMEYGKYLEAYDRFLELDAKYMSSKVYDFGASAVIDDIRRRMDEGKEFMSAVVETIRERFSYARIPVARPPEDIMSDYWRQMKDGDAKEYMFSGMMVRNVIGLEIVDDKYMEIYGC